MRKELIEGILASDQIGFHTDEYKQNFMQSCNSLLLVSLLFLSPCLFLLYEDYLSNR